MHFSPRNRRNVQAYAPWLVLVGFLLYVVCAALLLLLATSIVRTHRTRYRGVEYAAPMLPAAFPSQPWGVNVALEGRDETEMRRTLASAHQAGFRWMRQRFPWDEIETAPGIFCWEPWDRIVAAVREHDLALIAVLDGSPSWARAPQDAGNPLSPPQDMEDYVAWVAAFAARYGEQVAVYQIWDEPNIWPHWGDRSPDPAAYTEMLRASCGAIKAVDADAWVLTAGLAPTTESSDRNMNEVAYLRGMYDAGVVGAFDALAAKPYGFWSGPEDRRVDASVLNYSRLILLRETMMQYGDGAKSVWAVEMGWNALPADWTGAPSPWGTDSAPKQADRTLRALQRAREEWPWLPVICLARLQPPAAPDDPAIGFALLGSDGTPRLLYDELHAYLASAEAQTVAPPQPNWRGFWGALLILGIGLCVITWRGYVHLRALLWFHWWQRAESAFARLGDAQQFFLFGAILAGYILSPRVELALLAWWLLLVLAYWRLEWALLYATLTIPFSFYYRALGSHGFSLVETLTVISVVGWILRQLTGYHTLRELPLRRWLWGQEALWRRARQALDWRGLDGAWILMVLLSMASLLVSRYLAVSLRELRIVVLEPALFYFLVAHAAFGLACSRAAPTPRGHKSVSATYFADMLVLAGTIVALHGLYQYVATDDVIVTEGVRRIRGMYGSPNNMALLLGRILPLALAIAVRGRVRWRRLAYAAAVAVMLPCLFLTFSRASWLLGLPAALLFLGAMRGKKALLTALTVALIGMAVLVPLAGTERISSLWDMSGGTTLFRLSLWRSAVAMVRDHPLTGVGLDQFLYYYPEYILPEALDEPNLSHPHNLVLDFWLRLGIGGVLVLLWFLAAFFRVGFQLYHRLPEGETRLMLLGLMGSMVYTVAHGLVDNSYFVAELAFVFALSLGLAQRLEGKRE